MPENPGGLEPLHWQSFVDEAKRRRRVEGLTQREHAALANVSVPTLGAFDRGETTLTLAKAFDILRVVGLVEELDKVDAQESFVREASARWRSLTEGLPKDSPGRFPHGWYRFDYCLEGDLRAVDLRAFKELLAKAVTRHTGWPVFWVPQLPELALREIDGIIECWLGAGGGRADRVFRDPAHGDFWCAAPAGRLFFIRGYQEDGQETFPPGSILDTTLPIWRIGEALVHAGRLAALLGKDGESEITVRFRALYTGLSGRVLRAWANPLGELLIEGHAAHSDEAALETVVPAKDIEHNLAEHVFPLVASLYERFGVSGLSVNRVRAEIGRFTAQATPPVPTR